MFGFININKPHGMTSHDVVAALRRILKIKQIGHTGTLDPMATGVLPIAIGKASRLIEYLQEDKAYIAELKFGYISDTFDTEGNVKFYSDKKANQKRIEDTIANFRGEIEQIPPAHSAVHYKGKRLYELARQGIIPDDIPRRTVFVKKLELIDLNEQDQTAKLEIECSKGTYIRSIISDLGESLGTGAIMTSLVRTKSGMFTIAKATPLESISNIQEAEKYLLNPIEVLSYKNYELSEFEYEKIKHGQSLLINSEFSNGEYICLTIENNLCAIAQKDQDSKKIVTKKVFVS